MAKPIANPKLNYKYQNGIFNNNITRNICVNLKKLNMPKHILGLKFNVTNIYIYIYVYIEIYMK